MYCISSIPYYDQHCQSYRNILIINAKPSSGPILNIIKQIQRQKLSPFQTNSKCCPNSSCIYAFTDIHDKSNLLCISKIPELFSYLVENGYNINTSITKMMQNSEIKMNDSKLLCYIY